MGGDNNPRRPPIWECVCGCRRFRKVNWDGTVAPEDFFESGNTVVCMKFDKQSKEIEITEADYADLL